MKKTEYFHSQIRIYNECTHAIQDAKKARDQFIEKNADKISEVDKEEISITHLGQQVIIVVITFSYFEKF